MIFKNSFAPPSALPARAKAGRLQPAGMAAMLTAFLVMAGMAALTHAQSRLEEEAGDTESPSSWQEAAVQLPAAPVAENLLPFDVSATATQSFALDAKSLTLGADGVIRYTLVSRSAAGASNISYEGIRCQSFEKKLYAFGRADGSWARSRHDEWTPIARNAANRQHATLAQDYFCEGRGIAGDAETMLKKMRMQRPLSQ